MQSASLPHHAAAGSSVPASVKRSVEQPLPCSPGAVHAQTLATATATAQSAPTVPAPKSPAPSASLSSATPSATPVAAVQQRSGLKRQSAHPAQALLASRKRPTLRRHWAAGWDLGARMGITGNCDSDDPMLQLSACEQWQIQWQPPVSSSASGPERNAHDAGNAKCNCDSVAGADSVWRYAELGEFLPVRPAATELSFPLEATPSQGIPVHLAQGPGLGLEARWNAGGCPQGNRRRRSSGPTAPVRKMPAKPVVKCQCRGVSVKYAGEGMSQIRYRATISHKGTKYNLGCFHTEEEAGLAYDRAARRFHGADAVVNFPEEIDAAAEEKRRKKAKAAAKAKRKRSVAATAVATAAVAAAAVLPEAAEAETEEEVRLRERREMKRVIASHKRSHVHVDPASAPPVNVVKCEPLTDNVHGATQASTSTPTTGILPVPRIHFDAHVDLNSASVRSAVLTPAIVVLENFLAHKDVGIRNSVFDVKTLVEEHGAHVVDVLTQDATDVGWHLPKHPRTRRSLRQYAEYYAAQTVRPSVSAVPGSSPLLFIPTGQTQAQKQEKQLEKEQERERKIQSRPLLKEQHDTEHDMGQQKQQQMSQGEQETQQADSREEEYERQDGHGSKQHQEQEQGQRRKQEQPRPRPIAQSLPRSHQRSRSTKVQYCVNVDIATWSNQMFELSSKLPNWLWCQGSADMLSVVRQTVDGMNFPQLYVKVPGVWTGGHEENNRFRSINCSHGPGDSEWGAIEGKHVQRLREAVLRDVGIDIYLQEGRWFPDPAFCRRHGIPVMLCRQRPGDVIVLKGDTVHWVRSAGHAVNTSWNFGALDDAAQLRTALDRMQINTAIGFQNLVPVHTLALDLSTVILGSCGMLTLRSTHPGNEARAIDDEWASRRRRLARSFGRCCAEQQLAVLEVVKQLVEDAAGKECGHKEQLERGMGGAGGGDCIEALLEPVGALVVFCEAPCCHAEISEYYMCCDTCGDLNDRHRDNGSGHTRRLAGHLPMIMCVCCGLRHLKHFPHHHVKAYRKRAFGLNLAEAPARLAACAQRLRQKLSNQRSAPLPAND